MFANKPLQPGQVLMIVTAEIVHKAANSQRAALELRGARKLLRGQLRDKLDCPGTSEPECSEDFGSVGCGIPALTGEALAIERDQSWVGLLQRASKAHMVSIDL